MYEKKDMYHSLSKLKPKRSISTYRNPMPIQTSFFKFIQTDLKRSKPK